jgi:Flp pilus assembly protein TadG
MGIRTRRRRGYALIEFTIVGIPAIFLTASIIEMSLDGWQFESMTYAIQVAARYACQHGRTCTKNGNTCTIEVENVASLINAQAPSLDPSQLNVTLTTHSASVTCNPLNSCLTNTAQFPNSTDNGVGFPITITATYPMKSLFPMMWFGSNTSSGTAFTLGATAYQTIVY